MRVVATAILVCAGVLTGACGVKGPLFVPDVPKGTQWPYVKPKQPPAPPSCQPASKPAPSSSQSGSTAAEPGSPAPADSSTAPATGSEPAAEPKP